MSRDRCCLLQRPASHPSSPVVAIVDAAAAAAAAAAGAVAPLPVAPLVQATLLQPHCGQRPFAAPPTLRTSPAPATLKSRHPVVASSILPPKRHKAEAADHEPQMPVQHRLYR